METAIGSAIVSYIFTNFVLAYIGAGAGDGTDRTSPSFIVALGVFLIVHGLVH